MTPEQAQVVSDLSAWIKKPFSKDNWAACLIGPAGVGKTFVQHELAIQTRGRICFTATTNKAVRVLKQSLASDELTPETRTIYSLLGLTMTASGELKTLSVPDDPVDLSSYRAVVVDESSMVNKQVFKLVRQASLSHNLPILFVLDDHQIPPVGEAEMPVLSVKNKHHLTKVMRHDNQILTFAMKLRAQIGRPVPNIKVETDANPELTEGVVKLGITDFEAAIIKCAKDGGFAGNKARVIAWRNATVDKYNSMIRKVLFDNPGDPWLKTDRIVFTAPARDVLDSDKFIASTDDEGTIESVSVAAHPKYPEFMCYRVTVQLDEGKVVVAWAPTEDAEKRLTLQCGSLASLARANGRYWKDYWDLKESFHSIRHAYALTGHRAQGSTFETVFADWRDILQNRNRQEGFRILYVAASRPKKLLYLN